MFYLDTSLLVSALSNEPRSTIADEWLSKQDVGELFISDWVVTEFSSALSIKLRVGVIDTARHGAILAQFAQMTADTFAILPIGATAFRTAARFCDQSHLNLRAGDALHLAICAEHGATVCTFDQTMAQAARQIGVVCVLL